MTLLDAIVMASREAQKGSQPTELYIGTVTRALPLEIQIDTSQAVLTGDVLYLTDGVIERKISKLGHSHSYGGGTTGTALADVQSFINGQAVSDDTYILLSKGLATGDKVLLLAVQGGQKFVVLSHVY